MYDLLFTQEVCRDSCYTAIFQNREVRNQIKKWSKNQGTLDLVDKRGINNTSPGQLAASHELEVTQGKVCVHLSLHCRAGD